MSLDIGLILGPVVGHVTRRSAKIWAQTDKPAQGDFSIQCHVYLDSQGARPVPGSPFQLETAEAAGNTGVCDVALPMPNRRYYYRLVQNGRSLHDSFYTFAAMPEDNPDRLVFSVTSCHQPFKHENDKSTVMWRALRAELIREQAGFAFMVGDQVYADEDGQAWQKCLEISEDDPDSQSKRAAIYRDLYRKYWDIPDVKNVMANFPCYMIWDDHDITNGWGSSPSHADNKEQNTFKVARQAYIDFQHSHNPQNTTTPSALYYGFRIGYSAFMTLDLRGHRQVWNNRLLGQEQKDWIRDFIAASCHDAKVLFVISSVPMFHLDARWTWIPYPDITDQWSDEHNKGDRKWLMQRLFDWIREDPVRQVVILGGDVHVGTFATVTLFDESGEPTGYKITQATSSPVSNKAASFLDIFLRKVSASFDTETESGQKIHVDISPRYPARNFLMVTVDSTSDPDKPVVRFKMHWEGKKNPDPYPGNQGYGGLFNLRGRRFR